MRLKLKMNIKYQLYLLFFLFNGILISAQSNEKPDTTATILYNGKIFTANVIQPFANAVIIKNERILAVGNLEEIKKMAGNTARMMDLKGRVLLPGFVDSHNHAVEGGTTLSVPYVFEELLTPDSLAAYAKKIINSKQGMYGDVVMIDGINITTWSDIPALQRIFNHGFFAGQPVMLSGSDGHTAWANYAMLQRAGITSNFIKSLSLTDRNYYGIDPGGEPNGFVADAGMKNLNAVLPKPDIDIHQSAVKAVEYCNQKGITAWLDPAAVRTAKDTSFSNLDAYAWLASNNRLSAHVAALVVADANGDPAQQIASIKTIQKKYNNGDHLHVPGFKIFADGVIEFPSQTAALSIPYKNSGKKGDLLFDPAKFAAFATAADSAGLLVHVHAIGDRAVTETLNGFEKTRIKNGNSGIPHTITHLQIVLPADFYRFNQLNVLASFQLLWAFGDVTSVDIVQPFIDASLFQWQYPARSLLQAGALICGASDWPVTSADPLEAIQRAETRKGPLGVLDSSQCMPRLTMLYAYTINAAKALMMDKMIGSIEPGKYADMILLDKDILTIPVKEVSDAKVVWTMFKGKLVYRLNE
jgi:predicted amidohydrolase YtcJ